MKKSHHLFKGILKTLCANGVNDFKISVITINSYMS
jgi:hypothetical protein